ncbi:MAG: molecular chaperone TorD family protein [Acidimicrobiales bacterium]
MKSDLHAAPDGASDSISLSTSDSLGEFIADQNAAIAMLDLLAHWWSRPVADEVETWLGASELEEELSGYIPGTSSSLVARISPVEEMLDEYEQLFIGPGPVPCPPYESYWRNDVSVDIRRTLMGPCVADLNRLYATMNLEVAPNSGDLPDHVAIEFEALAYSLSFLDGENIAHALFFDHLMKWLPRFCKSVEREARLSFYTELARVTRNWLEAFTPFFHSIANDDLPLG